jgi:hypothetical protein
MKWIIRSPCFKWVVYMQDVRAIYNVIDLTPQSRQNVLWFNSRSASLSAECSCVTKWSVCAQRQSRAHHSQSPEAVSMVTCVTDSLGAGGDSQRDLLCFDTSSLRNQKTTATSQPTNDNGVTWWKPLGIPPRGKPPHKEVEGVSWGGGRKGGTKTRSSDMRHS